MTADQLTSSDRPFACPLELPMPALPCPNDHHGPWTVHLPVGSPQLLVPAGLAPRSQPSRCRPVDGRVELLAHDDRGAYSIELVVDGDPWSEWGEPATFVGPWHAQVRLAAPTPARVASWVRRWAEPDRTCPRCELGNHTGSNGTPGCLGPPCGCACRRGPELAPVVTLSQDWSSIVFWSDLVPTVGCDECGELISLPEAAF